MKRTEKISALLFCIIMAVTVAISTCCAAENAFYDVASDAWYAESVRYCLSNGLMKGVSDTSFEPGGTMTRAMLATVLYRQAGSPEVTGGDSFSDTYDGLWYSDAVCWAEEKEIIIGYGNGIFGTDDAVSREQMVTILWRMAGSPQIDFDEPFADQNDISSFALSAVTWAKSTGVVNGTDGGRFAPQHSATRAEAASILTSYSKLLAVNDDKDEIPSSSGGSTGGGFSRPTPAPEPDPTPEPQPTERPHVLVAYFSNTNNTKTAAQKIKDAFGGEADIFEIVPSLPYTAADLDYNTDCRANREQNDPTSRPEISAAVENIGQYDTVFVGYPIWWGRAPKIIYTFLESHDMTGKTVVPFCTSGSSPYNDSGIKDLVTADTSWLTGRRFSGSDSAETVKSWIDGLALPEHTAKPQADGKLHIKVNGVKEALWTATPEENSSVEALRELLAKGPVTISMSDYGGFEKVGPIGSDLPRNDTQTTTKAGDIILYQGSNLVIYYDANTYSFTRIGHVDDVTKDEMLEAFGPGDVTVTISLTPIDD